MVESVECVAVLAQLHYHPPAATQKHAAYVTWNLLPLCWDNNKLQSACAFTALTSHPLFCLQVFSECTSVYALIEEDSRAELSDILWGSVNVEGGAQRERERGRGGWRGGDNGSRCHEDSGIVGDLFCCLVFLFPSSFPHLLQVQKRKESWHSALVWGRQANDRTQRTPPLLSPVCGGFYVFVCTPLGTRKTVQTLSSQGQTHWWPSMFSHLSQSYM